MKEWQDSTLNDLVDLNVGDDPRNWHFMGVSLWFAAEELWKIFKPALRRLEASLAEPKEFSFRRGDEFALLLQNPYSMLAGMSIECWLKGVIRILKPKNSPPQTHCLKDLSKRAHIKWSDEQQHILERLENAIVWEGRYPYPKNQDKDKKSLLKSSEHDEICKIVKFLWRIYSEDLKLKDQQWVSG